ncbi:sensor histidine kinase [Microbacterium oleivorans]|uniref:sensor histidine kinase n=1 Tax=Microbacterium oleivorans TaxID=273677 RepID=UPI00203F4534|nr:histidine kinase [Microbacterium oleivorans]MCM3696357.1 histidine kinase [Microbacterium oleivorans]
MTLLDLPGAPADPRPRVPRWVRETLIAVVIAGLAFAQPPIPEFQSSGPAATALMIAPIVVLPWRHRRPIPALVVVLVLFGAVSVAGTLSIGVAVAVGVAMFQVSYRYQRSKVFLIGACVAVLIMVLALPAAVAGVIDPRIFQFGLIVAFATAAGSGARARHAYITAITDRAERAERTREAEARRRVSEERLRIARDLHDTVAHQIAVISLHAGVASSAIDAHPEKAKQSLVTIREASRTVLSEIGDLLSMLRSEDADDATPAPPAGLDRLDELAAQFAASGLDVTTRIDGDPARVTGAVDLVAYRLAQEGLTNAHKHGAGNRAHVLVEVGEDALVVTVTNPRHESSAQDGIGGSGLGLVGLRERVAAVRGSVSAGPVPGGWRLSARLPLLKEDA